MPTDCNLELLGEFVPGANYLVPLDWWTQFESLNRTVTREADFFVPRLSMATCVDNFVYEFRDELLEELQFKCNYLFFQEVRISPEIYRTRKWKAMRPALWKIISAKISCKPILSYFDKQQQIYQQGIQVRIVFCGKNRSDAFIGYVPQGTHLVTLLRKIGFEMGYLELHKSKISFPEQFAELPFTFEELENRVISSQQNTIIAFNMKQVEEEEKLHAVHFDHEFHSVNESKETVVGDVDTLFDFNLSRSASAINNGMIHERTLSTGAETPYYSSHSDGFDIDRQYRMKDLLFGVKNPEQIKSMKKEAKRLTESDDLIPLPAAVIEDQAQKQLEKMAVEFIDMLISERKCYKDKDTNTDYE